MVSITSAFSTGEPSSRSVRWIENRPFQKKLDPGTRSTVYNPIVTAKLQRSGFLRSGELARIAGVSADTLRHYERKGLLPAPRRSSNGYREYPAETLERVRLVRRALAVGFTIDELARLFKERDRGGAPCREVRSLAEEKLARLNVQISEMTAMRDELQALLKDWDEKLSDTESGERARLLESLSEANSISEERLSPFAPRASKRTRQRKESKR